MTRRCHLLDQRSNGLFVIIYQEGLFVFPRESNPSANNSNPANMSERFTSQGSQLARIAIIGTRVRFPREYKQPF